MSHLTAVHAPPGGAYNSGKIPECSAPNHTSYNVKSYNFI